MAAAEVPAFVRKAGPPALARRPWSRGAGPRAPGARRRAWRCSRAPCAARRRRSRRDAALAVQTHVGVQRRAARRGSARRTPPRRASAAPRPAARCRAAACSESASSSRLISTRDAGLDAAAARRSRSRTSASTAAGFSSGIMRRSSLSTTLPGTTLVLVPPSMRPTFRYGWVMPATCERHSRSSVVLRVQRVQDRVRALQRIDAGVGMAACAILPCTVTSSCRQPLWAVTTW